MIGALVQAYRRLQNIVLPERALVRSFIARHLRADGAPAVRLGFDLGAGTAPFIPDLERSWPGLRMVAVDAVADDRAELVADASFLPLADGVADLVTAFHLFQHVPDTRRALAEAGRVLKPDGLLLISFPFMCGSGRSRDLWRWTRAGMETELRRAGFTVVASECRGGPLLLLTSLVADMPGRLLVAHRRGWRSGRGVGDASRLALAFALALPFHLLGFGAAALDRLLSRDPALYVGGTVLARRGGDGDA